MKKIIYSLNNFEVKNLSQSGFFTGYASVFDNVDDSGDLILKGAFNLKRSIKILWQHKQDEPIGKLIEAYEDENGLYVKCQLMLNLKKAREVYKLIKSGIIDSLSIGYTTNKFKIKDGIKIIQSLDLWEISLVTFPANSKAKILQIKNNELEIINAIERAISILL